MAREDALRWIFFVVVQHLHQRHSYSDILGHFSVCVSVKYFSPTKMEMNAQLYEACGCFGLHRKKNQWTMFSGQITPFPSPGFRVCEWENFFFGCILRTQINQLQLVINDDSHKMKHFVFSLSTVNTLTCEINIYLRWQSVCSFITARVFFLVTKIWNDRLFSRCRRRSNLVWQ